MTRTKSAVYGRFFLVFGTLSVFGIAAVLFVLHKQRVQLPFQDTYTAQARFSTADGVLGGVGQPVNVVGVKVGQVSKVKTEGGVAVVTMQLQRDKVPELHKDASAVLSPVSPLKDMQVEILPGTPSAPKLPDGGTIDSGNTGVPTPLSDLLTRLDKDTRDQLGGLIAAVGTGTKNRAPDLRRMLLTLGPTARQAGDISRALARRRTRLAAFVHNLSALTRAASRDGELADAVAAGQQTLGAVAQQDDQLRQALSELPATLDAARGSLTRLPALTAELRPAVTALLPTIKRLPAAFTSLGAFSTHGADLIHEKLTPLINKAHPVVRDAGAAVPTLNRASVPLTGVGKSLNYLLNEADFVHGGVDQGYVYWASWFVHNLNSITSTGDANGAIVRAAALAQCGPAQDLKVIQKLLAPIGACQDK